MIIRRYLPAFKTSPACYKAFKTSLPLPLALIPEGTEEVYDDDDEDEGDSEIEKANADELDKDNASRAGKNKIKRRKLPQQARRKSTHNDSRNQRVTRSMEKAKAREGAGASRRRRSAPGGTKRKLDVGEDEIEEESVTDGESTATGKSPRETLPEIGNISDTNSFDLFTFDEPKKDWDDHPKMEDLMRFGLAKMQGVGWSSPKAGMGPEITMLKLAKLHQVKMPKTKDKGARVLVRALAIERLLADGPSSSKYYEDKEIKK